EDFMSVYDALGVCKFSRHMFFIDGFTDILRAYTGMDFTVSEILVAGERIYNMARAFNVREGFSRKDDYLPERVLKDPIPKGVSKGSFVRKEELDSMLDEYYQARGWSMDGIPTKAKLHELELDDIANEIGAGH
ncbi:MAG: aldehyde ferredoxin oxidoreductase C-terminal domain-containing protein, partial [Thermoplasmata archaeon]